MLDGDLLTSPVEQVLLDLGAQGATGCLYVTSRAEEDAEVYLRDGLVYAVFVPGRRPLLGSRLTSSGELAPESLAEALEIQRSELQGWRLGELLVHLGYVDRNVVESFVSEQLVDMLVDLLSWEADTWRFRKAKKTRQDVAPPQGVPDLLQRLRVRAAEWERLTREIGGPDAIPVLATAGAADSDVVLGPGEWAMLCKVDGERSVADLAADCGFTVFEAGHIIASLAKAGLVDMDTFEDAEDSDDSSSSDEASDDEAIGDGHDDPRESDVRDSVDAVTAALRDMFRDEEPAAKPAATGPEEPPPPAKTAPGAEPKAAKPAKAKSSDQPSAAPVNSVASDLAREVQRLRAERQAAEAAAQAAADEAARLAAEVAARQAQAEEEDRQRRAAEKDRRRREADTVAKAMEEARQRDLDKVVEARRAEEAAERRVQEAVERLEVEADAWADHRGWLDAERVRQEPAAWADHTAWLSEERSSVEAEAWAAARRLAAGQAYGCRGSGLGGPRPLAEGRERASRVRGTRRPPTLARR